MFICLQRYNYEIPRQPQQVYSNSIPTTPFNKQITNTQQQTITKQAPNQQHHHHHHHHHHHQQGDEILTYALLTPLRTVTTSSVKCDNSSRVRDVMLQPATQGMTTQCNDVMVSYVDSNNNNPAVSITDVSNIGDTATTNTSVAGMDKIECNKLYQVYQQQQDQQTSMIQHPPTATLVHTSTNNNNHQHATTANHLQQLPTTSAQSFNHDFMAPYDTITMKPPIAVVTNNLHQPQYTITTSSNGNNHPHYTMTSNGNGNKPVTLLNQQPSSLLLLSPVATCGANMTSSYHHQLATNTSSMTTPTSLFDDVYDEMK